MATAKWIEKLSRADRIARAKAKLEAVLDLFLYVVELHANNSFVVYSQTLASQIPQSYAAHAFLVFQRSMYQIEIVRLCALWDSVDPEKENIPTVVALIDEDEIIETLGNDYAQYWGGGVTPIMNPSDDPKIAEIERETVKEADLQFGLREAARVKLELKQAIADSRAIIASDRLASVMNVRDKHIAHSLVVTIREKTGPVQPMKVGDETKLLNASIPIIERLYRWVTGKDFSIKDSQDIDQANAEALWNGCKFSVLR